jgi:ComF family protein
LILSFGWEMLWSISQSWLGINIYKIFNGNPMVIKKYLKSLVGLIFPDLCLACRKEQPISGSLFCVGCEAVMPYCDFDDLRTNEAFMRIAGRLPVKHASSFVYFKSNNIVQNILHGLKYEGKEEIGLSMGKFHGEQLKPMLKDYPDIIVPVPLHPKKRHTRGYNQSEIYAKGLAMGLHIPVYPNVLKRKKFTETQTKMNKSDRLLNVSEAFELYNPGRINNKHILLVDDVLTSGATLEACGLPLLQIPGVTVSVATLALADNW